MDRNFTAPKEDISRVQTLALGLGIIFLIALGAGAAFGDLDQALRSYLLGFMLWTGIGVGSLGFLLLQHITSGKWGVPTRRIAEAGAGTIWFSALLFIPIMLGIGTLYHAWVHPAVGDEILARKAPYLNYQFFGIRAIIYFGLWSLMAYLLRRWSDEQDKTGEHGLIARMTNFAGPSMCVFILVVSFAAIDWVMTLDPHWFSAIFGLLFVIGWGLSFLAFTIAIMSWLSTKEPMNHIFGPAHFHDIGKLTLALVMVWAYFNFSQMLIIWSGNLPEETVWYLARMSGAWNAVGLLLILGHFVLPFLLLLSRDLKRNYRSLVAVAIFILVMRLVDLFYLIAPTANHGGESHFNLSWMDFVAPIGIGGLWVWCFLMQLKQKPLLPINDPYLEEAIEHGRGH